MAATRVTARPTTPNILRVFGLATLDEVRAGREWYPEARRVAEELAETITHNTSDAAEFDLQVERAVAVIAVLSPQVHWDRNVEMARRAYELYADCGGLIWDGGILSDWPGLKGNALKALRILNGEPVLDVVRGDKVTAFFWAILNPNDPRGIVIDRHAFDVAVFKVMDDKTRGIVLGRASAYAAFVRAYERAAELLQGEFPGITPAEVQAITWCAWRRLKKEGKI